MVDILQNEERQYRRPNLDPKDYKRIIYDPGRVTRIILNRPRYLNSMSHALLAELEDAFDRASEDKGCHVIVLSGAGSCFSSGDDNTGLTPESAPTLWDGDARPPAELVKQYGSEDAVWHQYNIEHDHLIPWLNLHKLRTVPKPTIAMVHGWCIYNAYSVANSMDLIFASEDALFLPTGINSYPMDLWTLGPRKVLEMIYEHRFLTAREGYESKFVNRVFPNRDILEKETLEYAYRVAAQHPSHLRRYKQMYINALDILGFSEVGKANCVPFQQVWRFDAELGHRMRYEGKGRARTPGALTNLKLKLDSEGAKTPEWVAAALARAAARDDKKTWQKVLHQDWRDPKRVARADGSAEAYKKWRAAEDRLLKAERKRRGL